jgi:hypothetical protein
LLGYEEAGEYVVVLTVTGPEGSAQDGQLKLYIVDQEELRSAEIEMGLTHEDPFGTARIVRLSI